MATGTVVKMDQLAELVKERVASATMNAQGNGIRDALQFAQDVASTAEALLEGAVLAAMEAGSPQSKEATTKQLANAEQRLTKALTVVMQLEELLRIKTAIKR